ncbi:MAG: hypothetical protein HY909_28300, partial [Deltaproteobacteria bacterium]|nr:hypothetical protein [Deltaproteobacteria bacterium]
LHPLLLVLVTTRLDGPELDAVYPLEPLVEATAADVVRRFNRFPELFHLDRWAMLSRRLGLYEYLYGQGFLVPRIYTSRLQRGLIAVYERGGRMFLGETTAGWAFDSVKLWSLARLLWDRFEDPSALRTEWANAFVGTVDDRFLLSRDPDARRLSLLFQEIENRWRRAAPSVGQPAMLLDPVSGLRSLEHGTTNFQFEGLGFEHKEATVTQFDYYPPEDVNRWVDEFQALSSEVRAMPRVQMLGSVLRLLQLLASIYAPVRRAYNRVRRDPAWGSDPLRGPRLAAIPMVVDPVARSMAAAAFRDLSGPAAMTRYTEPAVFWREVRQPIFEAISRDLRLFPAATGAGETWIFGVPTSDTLRLRAFWAPDLLSFAQAWGGSPRDDSTVLGRYFRGLKEMIGFLLIASGSLGVPRILAFVEGA